MPNLRRPTTALLASALAALGLAAGPLPSAAASVASRPRPAALCGQRSLLPAYYYPGPTWQATLAAARPGSATVVNPDSGPGASYDPNYARVVAAARAKGAVLWGYVDTRYAAVPAASVAAQVADYRRWYGITNVFFDDVSSQASQVGYYRQATLIARTGAPAASVILNPGDYPAPVYATLGDVLVVFEGNLSQYMKADPPAWTRRQPAGMFASLISAVPTGRLGSVLSLARARRSGWVYVSPHVDKATLYEQLPRYWNAELRLLASAPAIGPKAACAV